MPPRCPLDRGRVVPDLGGRRFDGRYVVRDLLGVGGMGSAVWRARQESTRRDVAIKFLPEAEPESARRFERGAQLASNLNHPHIVTVHDYGSTDDGGLFLVMELLEGRELTEVLAAHDRLLPETALRLADQALQALGHAHRQRVVHRDIKPGNLFIVEHEDEPPTLKVLDFGIARFFEDEDEPSGGLADRVDGDVTTVRKICGTPRYMSPEQIARQPVDGRTDLYSLGVVLYQCLTGRTPFNGDLAQLLYSHLHVEPAPLRAVRGDVHPLFESVVLRAMAKTPDARFASARQMRSTLYDLQLELGLLVIGPPTGSMPALTLTEPGRRVAGLSGDETPDAGAITATRTGRWGGLLAAVTALVVLLGVLWWTRHPGPSVQPMTRGESTWFDAGIRSAPDAPLSTAQIAAADDVRGAVDDAGARDIAAPEVAPVDAASAPVAAAHRTPSRSVRATRRMRRRTPQPIVDAAVPVDVAVDSAAPADVSPPAAPAARPRVVPPRIGGAAATGPVRALVLPGGGGVPALRLDDPPARLETPRIPDAPETGARPAAGPE